MVRPNHDIPNLLVGGIRDYASSEGISDEDAHAELLRIALSEVGILCNESEDSEE